LKEDDKPHFVLSLKNGLQYYYQLTVIDKKSGLNSYRIRHKNDTTYLPKPEDSINHFFNETKGVYEIKYISPEIYIDKLFDCNITDVMI
jgi:hypothetical protein